MKKETFATVATLATVMFMSQGSMAQDEPRQAGQAERQQAGQSDSSAQPAGERAGQQAGARAGQSGQRQNMDQKFVEFASTNDQFEIQAAQLAEQQASDDQVKQAAKMIRQDHEQSSKQLQQIAQQAGIQVSQQLKPHQQAMLQELKQMQGEEFDKAFTYGNVAGHTKAILKFRDASKQAQNPQLKQFAQQALPKLQQHLQHAQKMAQWDEASAQTAGARERAGSSQDRSGGDRSSDRAPGAGSSDRSSDKPSGGNPNR